MPRHARSTTSARRAAVAALLALAACASPPANEQGSGAQQAPPAPAAAVKTAEAAEAPATSPAQATLISVYKTPTCGCCKAWVEHLRQAGFRVETHDMDDVQPVKVAVGLPAQLASCHTAKVGNYAIEGHVPADVIARLLREHPSDIAGLAVPGMPAGSPGMEGMGKEPYDVIAFTKTGETRVYASR